MHASLISFSKIIHCAVTYPHTDFLLKSYALQPYSCKNGGNDEFCDREAVKTSQIDINKLNEEIEKTEAEGDIFSLNDPARIEYHTISEKGKENLEKPSSSAQKKDDSFVKTHKIKEQAFDENLNSDKMQEINKITKHSSNYEESPSYSSKITNHDAQEMNDGLDYNPSKNYKSFTEYYYSLPVSLVRFDEESMRSYHIFDPSDPHFKGSQVTGLGIGLEFSQNREAMRKIYLERGDNPLFVTEAHLHDLAHLIHYVSSKFEDSNPEFGLLGKSILTDREFHQNYELMLDHERKRIKCLERHFEAWNKATDFKIRIHSFLMVFRDYKGRFRREIVIDQELKSLVDEFERIVDMTIEELQNFLSETSSKQLSFRSFVDYAAKDRKFADLMKLEDQNIPRMLSILRDHSIWRNLNSLINGGSWSMLKNSYSDFHKAYKQANEATSAFLKDDWLPKAFQTI